MCAVVYICGNVEGKAEDNGVAISLFVIALTTMLNPKKTKRNYSYWRERNCDGLPVSTETINNGDGLGSGLTGRCRRRCCTSHILSSPLFDKKNLT